jgi:hypothetical protein
MGIFDDRVSALWTVYEVELQFRDQLRGGKSKDPNLIEQNLIRKLKLNPDNEELKRIFLENLIGVGVDIPERASLEEIGKALRETTALKQTNGFLRDPEHGLYIEAYQVKAGLKEVVNILFDMDGVRWGGRAKLRGTGDTLGKSPKSAVAEWCYVEPDRIYLDRQEPDDVQCKTMHVDTPQGPRDTLSYVEFVTRPRISFRVRVLKDRVKQEDWWVIWSTFQNVGLGADRALERGKFDIERWELVNVTAEQPPIPLKRPRAKRDDAVDAAAAAGD